jgi:hypothetical protein
MPDMHVRADAVNVEQIMDQIRARIREKRGVDYTEEQIREMANVKLEKFLDPRAVRSDLVEQFQRVQREQDPPLSFTFEEDTIYESHRAPIVRTIRRLLQPVLKLFFNPNPVIRALHIQSKINARQGLQFELMHNLVVEMTRLGIEVKNLRMRVESLTGRLEFNERRARALESLVVYRPDVEADVRPPSRPQPATPPPAATAPMPPRPASSDVPASDRGPAAPARSDEGPGQRSRRRRRRRGRRGGPPAAVVMGGAPSSGQAPAGEAPVADASEPASADEGPDDDASDAEPR